MLEFTRPVPCPGDVPHPDVAPRPDGAVNRAVVAGRSGAGRLGLFAIAVGIAASAGLATPARAQGPAHSEQPNALIESARAEGALMIYSSSDENQSKTLLAAFEKRYGIRGRYIRFPTGPLMQRFSTEYDARNVQADIVSVSSPLPYQQRPERFAKVDATALPNLARWPAAEVRGNHLIWTTEIVALAWNTEMLKPEEVPTRWADLADPRWKGRFLLTDPQVADNYLGWLDAVERANGVELLRRIAKQDYKITQSGASGAQMIAAGAHAFNAPTFTAFSTQLIAKKAPLKIQYMTGPTVVSPRSIAIVADAPHPNAARLYLNWLLSDEATRLTCQISPTSVVADPEGRAGCVPVRDGVAMRFDVPEERRRMLARELGVAR